MNYDEMDQEFTNLVEEALNSKSRVEIIYEAISTCQYHPFASPKLALQIAIKGVEK